MKVPIRIIGDVISRICLRRELEEPIIPVEFNLVRLLSIAGRMAPGPAPCTDLGRRVAIAPTVPSRFCTDSSAHEGSKEQAPERPYNTFKVTKPSWLLRAIHGILTPATLLGRILCFDPYANQWP